MSHYNTICYCCYGREEDEMELPEYEEDVHTEMIEMWLDRLEEGEVGALKPMAEYIKGAGADAIASNPDLRMRVLTETRIFIITNPSEERRETRMQIYNFIKSLRNNNPKWVD
jgi:hypothetical protein